VLDFFELLAVVHPSKRASNNNSNGQPKQAKSPNKCHKQRTYHTNNVHAVQTTYLPYKQRTCRTNNVPTIQTTYLPYKQQQQQIKQQHTNEIPRNISMTSDLVALLDELPALEERVCGLVVAVDAYGTCEQINEGCMHCFEHGHVEHILVACICTCDSHQVLCQRACLVRTDGRCIAHGLARRKHSV